MIVSAAAPGGLDAHPLIISGARRPPTSVGGSVNSEIIGTQSLQGLVEKGSIKMSFEMEVAGS